MISRFERILMGLLVLIMVPAVLFIRAQKAENAAFDSEFDSRPGFTGNPLPIGEGVVGHPKAFPLISAPYASSAELISYPRSRPLSGCIDVRFPKDKTTLFAAVPINDQEFADKILIQTPIIAGGIINICAPDGVSLEIILWTD